MSFASKWPLPVTHSVFSEREIVVLSFTLESNRCVCFPCLLESQQEEYILEQRNVNGVEQFMFLCKIL